MKSIRPFLFLCVLLSGMSLYGQQVVIKADTVVGVPGDSVTLAITYKNLSNIGSITLYIEFDPSQIKWGSALSWEPGFNNGFNMANASGNTLAVTCVNYNGFSSAQGKLVDLRFKFMGLGTAGLVFKPNCEITDINGITISPAPQYMNGFIVNPLVVTTAANPPSICQGSSTQVSATASGLFGTYTYQWASIPAGFSSNQPSFSVSPGVSTRYRCTVSNGAFSDTSSVYVKVLPLVTPNPVSSMIPLNGAININNHVTLSWAPAANTTSYDVYLWEASLPQPSSPIASDLNAISFTVQSNLTQGTTYKWRVISKTPCSQAIGPIYQFTMTAFPELHVTQVTVSAAYSGQPIDISWTVKNDGLGITTTPLWYDRVWISPDIEIRVGENDEDILLGTFENISYLGPGESYTQTQTVTLPPNLIGTYYIFVITDELDACLITWPGGTPQVPYSPPPFALGYSHGGTGVNLVAEVSDSPPYHDNFFYKEITLATPPLPDLKVINILKSSSIFSGQQLTVTYTVLNDGDASGTVNNWSDRIFLSSDTALNISTAYDLGTFNHNGILEPDSIYIKSAQVVVPNYISGNFFVYVYTDIFNNAFEHVYEGNNISRSDTLKVFLTPPPDLVVSAINIPDSASNNESIVVKFIVTNQGATATTAPQWIDQIYLSQSPTWDPVLAIPFVNDAFSGILGATESYSGQASAQIPKNLIGSWYIYVLTDRNNIVFEHNSENNNILRSDETILILNADLSSDLITIPPIDTIDATHTISWDDKNNGPGRLLNAKWNDKIYLSLNAVFDVADAVPMDSITNNTAIENNGYLPRQKSLKFPNVNTGNYYVYVRTDSKNEVTEGVNENNNIARSNGLVAIRRADLVPVSLTSSNNAQSGMPLSVTTVIKNIGLGMVHNTAITNKLYLSPTAAFNASNALVLGNFVQSTNLGSGDSIELTWNIVLPEGLTGNYYLAVHTDFTNLVKEGTHENNNLLVSGNSLAITNGPWADLQSLNFLAPSSVVAGNTINISFSVKNSGTKNTAGIPWKDKIYLSQLPDLDTSIASVLKLVDRNLALMVDSSYLVNVTVNIPATLAGGNYYLYVLCDASNNIFEYTDEDNNQAGPLNLTVMPYPLDFRLNSCSVNNTSLMSGQSFQMTYTVHNISSVHSISPQWFDAVYLSSDTILNTSTDILINQWQRQGPLNSGNSYTLTKMLNIPNGISGDFYLIAVTDLGHVTYDLDYTNNFKLLTNQQNQSLTLSVTMTPPPDLVAEEVHAPAQVIVGQNFYVHFTIRNQGIGTANGPWKEKLLLSQDFEINTGDIPIGLYSYNGNLAPGASYNDSMLVSITQNVNANFVLIFKTDGNNEIYEHSDEGNNTVNSFLILAQAPPVDLIVQNITLPVSAVVGSSVAVSWTISNNGLNPANGQLKDALYLSKDGSFSPDDYLWYSYSGPVSIPAQGNISRNIFLNMPGVTLGNYYLLVRTDVVNAFPETNDTNNIGSSQSQMNVDFRAFTLDLKEYDTLSNYENIYYKLIIPDSLAGETFLLTFKGDSINGVNEIYASQGTIPTRMNYQYIHSFPYEGNQELIIPSLSAGIYYFLVSGNTIVGTVQNISLLPTILNFEIRSVNQNKGGNTGSVTVKISGSKFTPDMTVFLVKGGFEKQASNLIFVDASSLYATFSLTANTGTFEELTVVPADSGVAPGFYDVVGKKATGEIAVLTDGFEVVQGLAPELILNLQYPASVRPNRFFSMSIQFVNAGNTDINIPVRSILSMKGAPLGFNTDELVFNLQDLYLEFKEPGGSPYVLRPGVVSEIKVYCYSSHELVFKLVDK